MTIIASFITRSKRNKESEQYQAQKERSRARIVALSLAGRDIGELPAVVNPERKSQAARDFRFFCESYFPLTFHLPWSPDHLKVIAKIEQAVLRGGLFAVAMPRGSGKTSLAETACIWAMLFGHREFVCLIGANTLHARHMLDSIKTELETNEHLLDDFPEAIYPIHALERIHQRAAGQLYNGEPTRITWTVDQIVLPTIPGSAASGAIIRVAGIESRIRGMKFKRPDGRAVRPTLVVIDDPQTDESARSDQQTRARLETLTGAILNLAGPGEKISGIMPCTVIQAGDIADQILDRNKHPEWNGERMKLVYSFPKNEALWLQYAELRADSFRNDGDGSVATEFYRANREAMDEGAVVAWPERYNHDELSAIQHAMNLKLQDEAAFFAEYQNEPKSAQLGDEQQLTIEQVLSKLNRQRRGTVPPDCTRLTAFIDVHQKLLYWLVAAWADNFTGYIIDYGTYPEQRSTTFALVNARVTLSHKVPHAGLEGAIYAGLEQLCERLLGKQWDRGMRIDRCLIDANWGEMTEVVYQFCRQSAYGALLFPSHGRAIGPDQKPMTEWQRRTGARLGYHWMIANSNAKNAGRYVIFDANFWKSFVRSRIRQAMGDPGSLSLFGSDPKEHRLLAEHFTSEYSEQTIGRGRAVDVWKHRPSRPDNHWWDCLVGAAVAASIQGATTPGTQMVKPAVRRRRAVRYF